MTEVAAAIGMFKALKSWLQSILNEERQLAAEEKNAIRALYIAANETQMYFNRLCRPYLARAKKEKTKFK